MKKLFLFISVLVCLSAFSQKEVIPPRPNPPTLVNDYTNTLTSVQVQALEDKLVAYDDSTSNQIAVIIVNSIGDYDISDYALRLGRAWGIGGKEFNNGVIVIVAKNDPPPKPPNPPPPPPPPDHPPPPPPLLDASPDPPPESEPVDALESSNVLPVLCCNAPPGTR